MNIGIVGPPDSCKKIIEIINKYYPEINGVTFQVSKVEEAYKTINEVEEKCEGIIFTGMAVYYETLKKKDISIPSVYIPFSTSSLMKAFWELNNKYPNCKNVLIDSVETSVINDTLKDLEIEDIKVQSMEYNHLYPESEYVKFHKKGHLEDKSTVSLIALGWVYDEIKNLGYPSLRLYSTRSIIRNSIGELISKIKEINIKESNVAVQIFYADCLEDISKYKQMEVSSKIEGNMVGYLKEIQGSMFNLDWNKYLIVSTKGSVESKNNLNKLNNILEYLSEHDIVSYVGTGLGSTSLESEKNANKALEQALEYGESCIFKVEDDQITGPMLKNNEISYKYILNKEELESMANSIDLNPIYIKKILSIKEKYNKDTFTSDELANYLDVSVRTANRIIRKILDSNCGEKVGKEINKSVGRPKNIIRINFDSLL